MLATSGGVVVTNFALKSGFSPFPQRMPPLTFEDERVFFNGLFFRLIKLSCHLLSCSDEPMLLLFVTFIHC